jgi:hypothetical protein
MKSGNYLGFDAKPLRLAALKVFNEETFFMKNIIHVLIAMNIFFAPAAFAATRVKSCGVEDSLVKINWFVKNICGLILGPEVSQAYDKA